MLSEAGRETSETLIEKEECHLCSKDHTQTRPSRTKERLSTCALCLIASVLLSLVWANTFAGASMKGRSQPLHGVHEDPIMSPAKAAIKHNTYQPGPDAWKNPLYSYEPSHESDLAWSELQTVRGVWVSNEEASRFNLTSLMAAEGKTATLLGVMHNIHCIRVLRQVLYPEYYYPHSTAGDSRKRLIHAGHCLEAIRQSVMCTPDLTPRGVFWEDEERSNIAMNPSAKQQCVEWSSLVEWERGRQYNLNDLWDANPVAEDQEAPSR